jgi:tetratricopeptide (TPR) repeat protein
MASRLPKSARERFERLYAEGDRLAENGDGNAALGQYSEAWDVIPGDKERYPESTRLLAAVGDVYFDHGRYEKAADTFASAVRCPDGLGNPYTHPRIGQCRFELGEPDRAADELVRAYMGAGDDIFASEDPKYFAFLKTRLEPPPGGW